MKKNELTNKIMDKVVKYEKSHTDKGVELWGLGVLIMLGIFVYAFLEMISEMAKTGTFDILSLLASDWEITKDVSDDLWSMVKYEFPWFNVFVAFLFLVILVVWIVLFVIRIGKARKTWKQIKKYFEE